MALEKSLKVHISSYCERQEVKICFRKTVILSLPKINLLANGFSWVYRMN